MKRLICALCWTRCKSPHPQFIYFLLFLVKFLISLKIYFGLYDSKITGKDSLLDNSNIMIGFEAVLQVFATNL